ncbi:protein-disulfide reductase DsbD domain-containing protein [Pedobacter boryungensis]|uniref:protein-disulfide reductase DsbD domain-containing protein n=1 Tax=Pedobacter boryungensis TaxID=869962 RepID=UPI001FE37BC7|nr:protein-disulfide reductase DsbD domain-containing protein [Pedobacter boryungensis]
MACLLPKRKIGCNEVKISYVSSKDFELIGKTIEPKPIKKYDKTVKMDLAYFEKEVVFQQKIKLNKATALIKVKIEFMVCNDISCLPADEITLSIPLK